MSHVRPGLVGLGRPELDWEGPTKTLELRAMALKGCTSEREACSAGNRPGLEPSRFAAAAKSSDGTTGFPG